MMGTGDPILLVASDFVRTGGMDRANFALAQYLANSGHEVHLAGFRAAADLTGLPNVSFHPAAKPLNSYFLGRTVLHRDGRRWASRIAARGGRVVVNGGNCRFGDVNWVHYVNAAYEPTAGRTPLRLWKLWTHRAYLRDEREVLLSARVVIVNSDRTKCDVVKLLGVPAERVHRVYLGIDRDLFRPVSPAERAAAKARMGWSSRPAIVFIGGLGDRRKGFDTLFEAWGRMAADRSWSADLAVIGTGAEMPYWKDRTASAGLGDRIHFLGFRRDVPSVLAACDAMIAPTRYEPYGMAVQEALAMGIPALVSRSAGVSERYPAGLAELLIGDPEDPDELIERLRLWMARKAEYDVLTAALSDEMRSHTWDDMAREMMQIVHADRETGRNAA